ncbi:hypothetical protein FA95DRAFT_1570209 [Auriscalpium vulgare]|uniref:Uncharacterized protein n=1 Tax=Auriscalpium vulgare TaxID=40419 RepID=A0ACB8S499_9AGAM|nr:hypothetical protein FA95DRAFT_1570209 [Auriscalpium vulgare]
MRASSSIIALALAAQLAPALAAPLPHSERFVLPDGLTDAQIAAIQKQFQGLPGVVALKRFILPDNLTPAQIAAIHKEFESRPGEIADKRFVLPDTLTPEQVAAFQDQFKNRPFSQNASFLKRFILPDNLTPEQVDAIHKEFEGLPGTVAFKRETVAGEVVEEGAKVAEKTVGGALKDGALSGLGTLFGGAGVAGLLDHFSHKDATREILEYLEARESAAGAVAEDGAKAVASSGIGKTIANGVAGTLTSLGVGGAISSLFDHFSSKDPQSRREFLEYLESRAYDELDARESAAGEVAEDGAKAIAKSGVAKTIANGVAGTLTSLGVGGAISSLFDHFSSKDPQSRRELLEYLESRAYDELDARESAAGEVAEDGAKAIAKSGVAKTIANGVAGTLTSLGVGGAISSLFDHFGNKNSQAQRDFLDFLERRADVDLAARESAAGEVAEDGAKAVAKSGIGKTIANGVIGTLTSLGVGGGISSLFDHLGSKKQAKRLILEFVAERAESELAARAMKRELLDSMLAARAINELD